jgi:pimeloyl-ACP methyl ester carboxylesterase
VVVFDGPGQGATLEDSHIPMTHEWEKPVGAVLDYFGLDDVTLIGVSLGGCLVMRAAAFDKRVKRVVADDVCTDFYETVLNKFPARARGIIDFLVSYNNGLHKALFNAIVRRVQAKDLMIEWGVAQGMHVMSAATPYDFLRKCKLFNTRNCSPLASQDVLLMAGEKDHYIPFHQFDDQSRMLVNARSVTKRLFTEQETAQNHCQLGNIGLSVEVIGEWVEGLL